MGANGILVVDKPAGWTSMDVCAKLRGAFHEKRVGHGGTLDPMATGVLPVFFGRATRAVEFVAEGEKEYEAVLRLGLTTNTQDVWGETLEEKPVPADAKDRLKALLPRFTGELEQVPPMYSAVKLNGKKLYELARKGVEVERKPRRVTICSLAATWGGKTWTYGGKAPQEPNLVFLQVRCSKGTYIRTLCHDIGQALGCGGCMAGLRRTETAGFRLDQAVSLEEALAAAEPAALLRPVDSCFEGRPALTIDGRALFKAKNGNPFPAQAADGLYRVYGPEGEFLLLGRAQGGIVTTVKSFFEV